MSSINQNSDLPKLDPNKIKFAKAKIKKTLVDENGMTYEVEEEFDVPVFNTENKNERENK